MAKDKRSQTIESLDILESEARQQIKSLQNLDDLEKTKLKFTGLKSKLGKIIKSLSSLNIDDRKIIGKKSNLLKALIEKLLQNQRNDIERKLLENIEQKEQIDITLPGEKHSKGAQHPLTQMQNLAEDIFEKMGFEIAYPYMIDDDYHNFESVNLPPNHPARDSWDTFWTEDGHIAITHTSSMQNRILKAKQPPIRVIVPGRCFRREATDARHEHTFHQIEGIYVDKGITLTDMLGTLKEFFSKFYEKDIDVKFTPDFFPFVEPGGMMSLSCVLCGKKGCSVCKQTGWLEIMGCGMIHKNVLEMAGIDYKTYSGFAWGFGLERIVMLKYDIKDVRLFHSGNLDFIKQF